MAEKNTSRLLLLRLQLTSCRIAQWYVVYIFALEEVGSQVQISAELLPIFFFFSILPSACFYPLACFCLFSLLTPFSFARFFRQRISRVSMGWWHLRFSAKILALLRLSFNFLQLRLTKKLKINFFVSKS